ncbi:mannonate dehydratase [Olivibacter domesticus]|uniref:mannonate dehydratase n=1 Tax=Olivibacter domesticus TaxID=407022 RepID=A0A1H7WAM8_OLID1|nr:mannonate dehydratase [Olivibacter domesticus]SEM18632.1 mannonate dehydratase [Olivibacter domesticus]
MEDNRRNFIKKGISVAAALSLGGLQGSAHETSIEDVVQLNSFAKDAGMEMSNAYFSGIEANKQLIALAKQMDALGAVAGVNPGLAGLTNVNPWEYKAIIGVKEAWKKQGLKFNVVEGPPSLGEKTKLGLAGKDEEIENFIAFMKNLKKAGIDVICYNWMPVISWARTSMDRPGRGGALMTAFDYEDIKNKPLTKYGEVSPETMWKNLEYFLKAVVPEAEKIEMKLALHPDDPQVNSIQGISRIMNTVENFDRMLNLVPSPYSGVTMCQGNFSLMGADIPALVRRWGKAGKIHFVHFRNVQDLSGVLPSTKFTETFHDEGQIDMYEAMKAYYDIGFKGPIRPDHVPTMAGEENTFPGYMTLGNLFAIGYIRGLAEAASKRAKA